VTFHGNYEDAERERSLRGRLRLAVTWGHNKDHRPDFKQLLYILTDSGDGAVPVHLRTNHRNETRHPWAKKMAEALVVMDESANLLDIDAICSLVSRSTAFDCSYTTGQGFGVSIP
jgi:hypothetical protein